MGALFGGGIIASLITAIVNMVPGLAKVIGDTIVTNHQTEAARQGKQDDDGKDLAISWLASVERTNAIKASSQTERQVIAGLMLFALPVGLLFWGAILDGMPFHVPFFMSYPHIIGSWGITIAPEFAADVHMIIQSFFIAAPMVGAAAIVAKTFRRSDDK